MIYTHSSGIELHPIKDNRNKWIIHFREETISKKAMYDEERPHE